MCVRTISYSFIQLFFRVARSCLFAGLFVRFQNFSAQEIVGFVFPNHTGVFSVQQFYQMCPVLLQQVTMVRHPVGPTAHIRRNDATVALPDLKKVTVIEATGIQCKLHRIIILLS